MELTKTEAIDLILEFFTHSVWVDKKHDNLLLIQFINAGLTCLDAEDNRKIVPNELGKNILFSYFSEISEDFIAFMQKKGLECPANEVVEWFAAKYELNDITVAEDIAFLIAKKLYQFGYITYTPRPERKHDKFILQKA